MSSIPTCFPPPPPCCFHLNSCTKRRKVTAMRQAFLGAFWPSSRCRFFVQPSVTLSMNTAWGAAVGRWTTLETWNGSADVSEVDPVATVALPVLAPFYSGVMQGLFGDQDCRVLEWFYILEAIFPLPSRLYFTKIVVFYTLLVNPSCNHEPNLAKAIWVDESFDDFPNLSPPQVLAKKSQCPTCRASKLTRLLCRFTWRMKARNHDEIENANRHLGARWRPQAASSNWFFLFCLRPHPLCLWFGAKKSPATTCITYIFALGGVVCQCFFLRGNPLQLI